MARTMLFERILVTMVWLGITNSVGKLKKTNSMISIDKRHFGYTLASKICYFQYISMRYERWPGSPIKGPRSRVCTPLWLEKIVFFPCLGERPSWLDLRLPFFDSSWYFSF